jgi:outer membrane receptor protein involved in Fe transport
VRFCRALLQKLARDRPRTALRGALGAAAPPRAQIVPLLCGFPFTSNAGDAHIYGVETEINAVVLPGLVASVNGSWLHAEYAGVECSNWTAVVRE